MTDNQLPESPVQSPVPVQLDYHTPNLNAAPRRPGLVTAVGITGMIWASLSLLCGVLALYIIGDGAAMKRNLPPNSLIYPATMTLVFLGPVLALMLMIGSYGVLNLMPWGRMVVMLYSVLILLFSLVEIGIVFQLPRMIEDPKTIGGMVLRVGISVFFLIALCVPDGKQAFVRKNAY